MTSTTLEQIRITVQTLRDLGVDDTSILDIFMKGTAPDAGPKAAPTTGSPRAGEDVPGTTTPRGGTATSRKGKPARQSGSGKTRKASSRSGTSPPRKPPARRKKASSSRKSSTPRKPTAAKKASGRNKKDLRGRRRLLEVTLAGGEQVTASVSNRELGVYRQETNNPDATREEVARAKADPERRWTLKAALARRDTLESEETVPRKKSTKKTAPKKK